MAVVISLREVVDGIELQSDESEAYLDPETGEIVAVTEDERRLVEEVGRDEKDLPEWQREALPKIRAALESGRYLRLPNRFDVHGWDIMKRFSQAQENERIRHELQDAIHGARAFRMFRSAVQRLGLEDAWFRFRDGAIEEIARQWLEEHNLPYK
jgi:hypothetical protein